MAFASHVLMFAGIPQTLVGCATAQDSLLTLFDMLPAYVRHVRGQLEQRFIELSSFANFLQMGCSPLKRLREPWALSRMKAVCCLVGSNLLLAACNEAASYTYSKANFTSPTFKADLSACRHFRSSTAYQVGLGGRETAQDGAPVRDCMKAKGYIVQLENR
jgi:hypothetical protein